jgi:cell division protein FtsW
MLSKHRKSYRLSTTHGPWDLSLLVAVILLVIFGLIMVYDSSVVQAFKDHGDKYFYIKQQLIWVILGLGGMWFFSKLDYSLLKKIALPFFILGIVLLLAVLVPGLGVTASGAHRWLKLGPASIQPAEIIKLAAIIFFAALFDTGKLHFSRDSKLGPFILSVGFISFVIGILQKDLGSTIVFFLTSLGMYVVAGAPLNYLIGLIPVSVLGFAVFALSSSYRKDRILAFLDPFSDPQGYSYHIAQVLIALGSGGIFGLGLGQSRQKYEYIPEVTTDSIFAIVGEEFGFIGCTILIVLITYLIFRGFKIAENVHDPFGKFLASGLTIWLGVQAIVNLAAMVSLIPLTGVPLPFISYGGSALLVNLVAVGILLNISKSAKLN